MVPPRSIKNRQLGSEFVMSVEIWLSSIGDYNENELVLPQTSRDLALFFPTDLTNPLVAALQNDIWDNRLNVNKCVDNANLVDGTWPGFTAMAKAYLQFCRGINPNDPIGSFNSYAGFFQAVQMAYGSPNGCALNGVVQQTTKTIVRVFRGYKTESSWVTGTLLRIFNSVRSDKPGPEDPSSKQPILLFVATTLCRLYFVTGQHSSSANVLNNIHSGALALSAYPMAQQVEFRYWFGRFHLARNSVVLAFKHLYWAYARCPNESPNKLVILKYMLVPSIIVGRLPRIELLNMVGLAEPFMPLLHSLKTGTFAAYNSTVDHPWFRKHHVDHVLRRHIPALIWRKALKRLQRLAGSPTSLGIGSIQAALSLSEATEVSAVAAESICLSLINQGYMRAIRQPSVDAFGLKSEGAFPPLLEVTHAFSELSGKDSWMNK